LASILDGDGWSNSSPEVSGRTLIATEMVAELPQSRSGFLEKKNPLLLPVIELRFVQAIADCAISTNVSYQIACFNLFFLLFCFKNTERKATTISLDKF
jgi:hypothetical protein